MGLHAALVPHDAETEFPPPIIMLQSVVVIIPWLVYSTWIMAPGLLIENSSHEQSDA